MSKGCVQSAVNLSPKFAVVDHSSEFSQLLKEFPGISKPN